MLNVLVLIFNGVHLKKMFGIINLLLKLNIVMTCSVVTYGVIRV